MTGSARAPNEEQQIASLLLFEHNSADGKLERWYLIDRGAALAVTLRAAPESAESALPEDPGPGPNPVVWKLPSDAPDAVMRRYGRPLEAESNTLGPRFDLASGGSLRAFRHLARFDVIGLDYLLYCPLAGEPLAALAAPICAALRYLAQRLKDTEPAPSDPASGGLGGIDPSRA